MARKHRSVSEKEKEVLERQLLREKELSKSTTTRQEGLLRMWQRLRGFGIEKTQFIKRIFLPDVDDSAESIGFQPKAMRVHVMFENTELVPSIVNDILDLTIERALSKEITNQMRKDVQPEQQQQHDDDSSPRASFVVFSANNKKIY